MLVGTLEVLFMTSDVEKTSLAQGFEMYYPLGINDPDYSVPCASLRSTATITTTCPTFLLIIAGRLS